MSEAIEGLPVERVVGRDAVRKVLRDWNERMQELEEHMGSLCGLLGTRPEFPLMNAIYAVAGLATDCTAERVGCSREWLEAWWLEHNFGERPMRAGLVGEPLRTLATIDDLADLICDDLTPNNTLSESCKKP